MRDYRTAPKVRFADFRGITRDPHVSTCRVDLEVLGARKPWLAFGTPMLERGREGRWVLKAHLRDGATDGEHDSAYALKLPLVGLEFTYTLYGHFYFRAFVSAEEPGDFRVPHASYDPFVGAQRCRTCKGKYSHAFCDFLPPAEPGLYEAVAGLPVVISAGCPEKSE